MNGVRQVFIKYSFAKAALIGLLLLFLGIVLEQWFIDFEQREQRLASTGQLAEIKSRIENTVNFNLNLIGGLTTAIAANPDITQQEFSLLARETLRKNTALRNVAAAPDLVIRYIYPLSGNEAALGLDYKSHPTQKQAVMLAIENNATVIAGPLSLVQGGRAFVSRTPVFYFPADSDDKKLWGVISTVMDVNRFYTLAGLYDESLPLQLAIRGKDAMGERGAVIFGDESIYAKQPVITSIRLPYGSWQMAAMPHHGWTGTYPGQKMVRAFFLAAVFLVMYLVSINETNKRKRWQAERDAHQANLEKAMALESSDLKSAFLANVSHELRTPLHAILSFSSLGLKNTGDDKTRRYFENIRSSGERLIALLNDLLDLSKLETGNQVLHIEEHDLREVVQSRLDELHSLADEKQIEVLIDSDESQFGSFDEKLMGQVIINLLSNAIKFSPDNARILITLRRHYVTSRNGLGHFLTCGIHDQGIGIPDIELEKVFEKFVQSSKTSSRTRGTGLGLPICREIIEHHHGKIWCVSPVDHADMKSSQADYPGASFYFRIPLLTGENSPT